jgi:hypothetical protein
MPHKNTEKLAVLGKATGNKQDKKDSRSGRGYTRLSRELESISESTNTLTSYHPSQRTQEDPGAAEPPTLIESDPMFTNPRKASQYSHIFSPRARDKAPPRETRPSL